MQEEEGVIPNLTHAVSFLPLARSSVMLQYYNNIDQAALCDGLTEVVAMDLGLKETLFNRNIPTTFMDRASLIYSQRHAYHLQ